jgi:integrase
LAASVRDVDFQRAWDPEAITKAFRRVVIAAGFPDLRLHDLRHTHATLLLMAGVPVHEVAQRLGHSTPVITMTTYAHVIQRNSGHASQVWAQITAAG